ncbi:hypothetical protein Tco_1344365 [Tanacetum coccineum]
MTFKVLLHHYGRFTSPPGRKFVDGIVATVDPVELSNFSSNQMKAILTKCLGYDENSATFLYIKKSNRSLDSGLVLFDDAIQDIDSIVSYTQTYQKLLHVYVSRVELSPLVVADQLEDGDYAANSVRQTILSRLRREQEAEATLADKLLCELTRVVEQMQTREIHITMLHAMPITSLNIYGLHTLLMTQEADIRTTYNLRTTRDELLRSIVEKQKFIDNYMAI